MAISTSSASWFQHWNPPNLYPYTTVHHRAHQEVSGNYKYFQIADDVVDGGNGNGNGNGNGEQHQQRFASAPPVTSTVFEHRQRHPSPPGSRGSGGASSQSYYNAGVAPLSPYNQPYEHPAGAGTGGRGDRRFQQASRGEKNSVHRNNKPPYTTSTMTNLIPYLISLGMLGHQNSELFTYAQQTHSAFSATTGESTGPFKTLYLWRQLDFAYPSPGERAAAIASGEFVPENNLPLGVEVWKDRMFVSMPKWKGGVPVTLGVLPKVPTEVSPALVPYPSWDWQTTDNCELLVSVYRMQADVCGRLWVLDSGQIDVTINPQQICPPKVLVFDLQTDKLVERFELPEEFIKQDGLYSNILVDVHKDRCDDAYAYLTDVWRFGLVVYSLKSKRSWRIYDHLFYPDPLSAAYNLHGLEFEWSDGIFGMTLTPEDKFTNDRIMYFHPMSSFREFYTRTSILRNETGWEKVKDAFKVIGQSRGKSGHTSASAMDRNGVMFYNMVTRDSVGCWDTRKPYKRANLGVVAKSNETMVFPNDLKIDTEDRQSVWVLSNRLPYYLYRELDPKDINFRIMSAYTDEAIKGNICDPRVKRRNTFEHHPDGEDCY